MKIIDMHCDTICECYFKHKELRKNDLHIDAEKLTKGDYLLQCFAIWFPTHKEAEKHGGVEPYEYYHAAKELFENELKKNEDLLAPVRGYSDILRNAEAGKVSAMLTTEDGGAFLEGKAERFDEAFRDGMRMMAPLWNYENCFGYPNSTDPEVMGKSLKPFGFEMLERAQELGVVIDVSHLNDGGFWDIVSHTKKPFLASHSDCRALCDVPRALSDEMLRALADKGGVAGLNFYAGFLRKGGVKPVTFEIAAEHVMHMLDVGGEDLPAIGSDYDGIPGTELAWHDASRTKELFLELEKRGVSARVIDKIASGNTMRVFKECLPE